MRPAGSKPTGAPGSGWRPPRRSRSFGSILPARAAGRRRTASSDRYSAYCHLVEEEWQICWGHLDRKFVGWAQSPGRPASLGKAALAASRRVVSRWHQVRAGALPHGALAAYLQPVKERLRQVMEEAAASGHRWVEGPSRHLLKHYGSLW